MSSPKLLRITTVPISLKILLKGQHRFMSQNGFEVIGVSSSGKELQDVEQHENVRVAILEMTRTISPFNDLKSLWDFYKFCKRECPTIVHSHTPKAGIVGMLGAKLAGVPVRLHTVAGMPLMEAGGIKRKLLDVVERLTYRCATKVYPNSRGLYDFILAHGYTSKQKLEVIANGSSNGIDTEYFDSVLFSEDQKQEWKQSLLFQPNDFVFVFVGRLVGDKGINELIEAFFKLPTPNTKLLLVGPFESVLDPLHQDTLQALKTNPNIISVGFQEDVRPYFAISDCLVFPSYREGFPNVVMQAGAMGLPSIVTDINGCNEIIVEGENGIIIPVKNVSALVDAMQKMCSDKAYYEQLQPKARPMIQSRYEQKVLWNALLAEYNSLLAQNNSTNGKKTMYRSFLKSHFDFTIALIGLLFLSPIFTLVTLCLFIANNKKPFFFQKRPGKNGRIFRIIKFKTMNDKKDAQGNLLSDAERITAIGKFVRKTSLDEIPQLINVLKGDMSLIGPRPLLPEYLPLYNDFQKRRHEVKPGITGWAQANGRNAISWEEKFNYDVWYVDNISFNLDIKIYFLTIQKVFLSEGVSQKGEATMEAFNGHN